MNNWSEEEFSRETKELRDWASIEYLKELTSKEYKVSWGQLLVGLIFVLILVGGPILITSSVFPKVVLIDGKSMEPTLRDGDITICFVSKDVEHDSLYVIRAPDGVGLVVKRLIGMPGDVIELVNGDTYRNSQLILKSEQPSWDNATFSLGENEYLFLGDNREESYDGRYWSEYVHEQDIRYKVTYIFYSLNDIKKVG